MLWNLNDHFSPTRDTDRYFHLPLAGKLPNFTSPETLKKDVFTITENRIDGIVEEEVGEIVEKNLVTTDWQLSIKITPPEGGFQDDGALPASAIRLHAVDAGFLRFIPATDNLLPALELRLLTFLNLSPNNSRFPKWWDRWKEAQTIPAKIVYENVEVEELKRLVRDIPILGEQFGLSIPMSGDIESHTEFVEGFLKGENLLYAKNGAYLGKAAPTNQSNPTDNSIPRMINLYTYYNGHTPKKPLPMNTRELFYLLFGDESYEAETHPLLLKIQEIGENQKENPRSRRMLLRPPLRTSKRVEWEATQEITHHSKNWAPRGILGNNRLYNDHERKSKTGRKLYDSRVRQYNRATYAGSDKCNLFVADICLRAGFKACIHPTVTHWHYMNSNSHANLVYQADKQKDIKKKKDDRIPLHGLAEKDMKEKATETIWGWKIENWIRSFKTNKDRQNAINKAIQEEGRCFIVAGARGRRFDVINIKDKDSNEIVRGIKDCKAALNKRMIGHIVIVKDISNKFQLKKKEGDGFEKIKINSWQATGEGAEEKSFFFKTGGASTNPSGNKGFIKIHLFELNPGMDPDTLQGLKSLNIVNEHKPILGDISERAKKGKITHDKDDKPLLKKEYCEDNDWPPKKKNKV